MNPNPTATNDRFNTIFIAVTVSIYMITSNGHLNEWMIIFLFVYRAKRQKLCDSECLLLRMSQSSAFSLPRNAVLGLQSLVGTGPPRRADCVAPELTRKTDEPGKCALSVFPKDTTTECPVRASNLEPATFRLLTRRSNQLSYAAARLLR